MAMGRVDLAELSGDESYADWIIDGMGGGEQDAEEGEWTFEETLQWEAEQAQEYEVRVSAEAERASEAAARADHERREAPAQQQKGKGKGHRAPLLKEEWSPPEDGRTAIEEDHGDTQQQDKTAEVRPTPESRPTRVQPRPGVRQHGHENPSEHHSEIWI